MGYFPVMLNMSHKSVALVGSGLMALEKLRVLKAADAMVEVFDTVLDEHMASHIGGRVTYTPRLPVAADLMGRILVIAAHGDPMVNTAAAELARTVGALINVVDVPAQCDAVMVSQLRRGDLVIGVSTGGRGPGLARRIREMLEPWFDEQWADRLVRFGDARHRIRGRLSGYERSDAMGALEEKTMADWTEVLQRRG